MTAASLIDTLIERLHREHYAQRPAHEFGRDLEALKKAIARYGHVCFQKGWEFDAPKLFNEIAKLLDELNATIERGARVNWLPLYLESAVNRSIHYQADRLSADARKAASFRNRLDTILKTVESKLPDPAAVPVRRASDAELLSLMYLDLSRRRRIRRAQRKEAAMPVKEGKLL